MKHFTIFDFIASTLIILIGIGFAKLAYDQYIIKQYLWMGIWIGCLFGGAWVVSGWIKENKVKEVKF